jgi:hypothetical protein
MGIGMKTTFASTIKKSNQPKERKALMRKVLLAAVMAVTAFLLLQGCATLEKFY